MTSTGLALFLGMALLSAAFFAPAAFADIDHAELETRSHLTDRKAQEKYLRQIEIDKAEEAKRDAERAEQAKRAEEERRRAEEARPWPVRLTEQRCTLCHPADNYTRSAHALPGWWAVVLRMKYVNDAPVSWAELQIIVPHLAEQQPADWIQRATEWLLLMVLVISPLILAGLGWLTRRVMLGRMQ